MGVLNSALGCGRFDVATNLEGLLFEQFQDSTGCMCNGILVKSRRLSKLELLVKYFNYICSVKLMYNFDLRRKCSEYTGDYAQYRTPENHM